ncbi:agamous-like MADS-box protein AGL14 [Papaver somniferum]|uniref:agamous-like MADS-box protein AGL14 n=1 Tax=Papaver somniferum TaxID=3469 RepID=UPI000E704668|nr:agamous-like MADS-box protein AGL14 [Papaver somniferum]
MGQKKIEIERIVDPQKRMVTFSKRREGIKSKATELCRLFADIIVCIIVFSPGGKAYTFTNSPVGVCNMVQRFLEEQRKGKKQESENVHRSKNSTQCRNKAGVGNGSIDSFWWDNIDNEELDSVEKLKSVKQSLEKLKQNLCARKEVLIASSSSSSSSTIEDLIIDEDCIIEDRIVEDAATTITEKHEAREACCKDQPNLDLSLNLGW